MIRIVKKQQSRRFVRTLRHGGRSDVVESTVEG